MDKATDVTRPVFSSPLFTGASVVLIAALTVVAAPAAEDVAAIPAPDDYAWGWTVEGAGNSDFHEVILPLEVYQSSADSRLRDLAVFNGDGSAVPRVLREQPTVTKTHERTVDLSPLPLFRSATGETDDVRLVVTRAGASTEIDLTTGTAADPAERRELIAYVVATGDLQIPLNALEFSWKEIADPFIGQVTIDSSDNLSEWRRAGQGRIAALSDDSTTIERKVVAIGSTESEYLRITWQNMPEGWLLDGLTGFIYEEETDVIREYVELDPTGVDDSDGGRLFDVGGWIPADEINLLLPADNTLFRANVYVASETGRWHRIMDHVFYNFRSGDDALEHPPTLISPQRIRYVKVVPGRGRQDAEFRLQIGWRPHRLIFVAQGNDPYLLVIGRASAKLENYPEERNFGEPALYDLYRDSGDARVATLSPRTAMGGPGRLTLTKQTDWQTWILWGGLASGVLLIGLMVLSLFRQMKQEPGEE